MEEEQLHKVKVEEAKDEALKASEAMKEKQRMRETLLNNLKQADKAATESREFFAKIRPQVLSGSTRAAHLEEQIRRTEQQTNRQKESRTRLEKEFNTVSVGRKNAEERLKTCRARLADFSNRTKMSEEQQQHFNSVMEQTDQLTVREN